MSHLSWKTIDKLDAKVPGADSYRGERVEFDVRFGRPSSPLSIDSGDESPERFRIENKQYDIAVEAPTLHEAKQMLREKLAASEDFSGTWKLWMHVDVNGGGDFSDRWGSESANCSITVKYYIELTSGYGKALRRRHMSLRGALPHPFTGEFPVPNTHQELSQLKEGAVKARNNLGYYEDDMVTEATPEIVETIRVLQHRLAESGEQVAKALSKKRFLATVKQIQTATDARLLTTSIVSDK